MLIFHGRNTLEALDVPLSELYALRRSRSNTLSMPDVDRHLSSRPDYVVYRLLRERQPHAVLDLPAGTDSGADLLLRNLKLSADNPDPGVKWTVYGLVAINALRIVSVERKLRFVRISPRLTPRSVPEGDRVTDEHLAEILKWMLLRQRKFTRSTAPTPETPLRSNRRRTLSRNHLLNAEQLLLLALGQISIWLVSNALGRKDDELANETLRTVTSLLSNANGGWRPGQAVFVQNLQHHRAGYGGYRFSSCYLPFQFHDYDDWIADAFGRLVRSTRELTDLSDHRRLMLCLTSIQHRERLFSQQQGQSRKRAGNSLMIALDRTFPFASNARRMTIAARHGERSEGA